MSTNNIFKKITRFFTSLGKRASPSKSTPQQDAALLGSLFQMAENSDEIEITCDEVFALLDVYVELEARGENAAVLLPLVRKHLDKCRDCHEEYEALVRVVQASPGLTS